MNTEETNISDNRMSCLRYIENLDQNSLEKETDFYSEEYEYFSDSRVTGVFSLGKKRQITFRIIEGEKNENGYYRYLLHVPMKMGTDIGQAGYKKMMTDAKEDGYYFKEGMAGEFISIFAVFLRARFYLRSRTFRDKEQVSSKTTYPVFLPDTVREYTSIFNDEKKNLTSDLIPFFQKIQELPDVAHFNIIHSFKEYHQALKNLGVDHDISYLKLVVAIEGIAVTEKPRSRFSEDFPECFELIKKEKKRLEQISTAWATRGSFKSVVTFLEKYLLPTHPEYRETKHMTATGVAPIILINTLERIYKARSKYVHEGLPVEISRMGFADSPYQPSLGGIIDKRRLSGEEMLPMISYFEEMVHKTLLAYVEINSGTQSKVLPETSHADDSPAPVTTQK